MAKKPPPGRCVHCLAHSDCRNWDHVFPVSWYPENTPQNLAKWKIPSCLKCNKEYGVLEEDLLVRLALCIDPQSENNRGIVERAFRSIDPSRAKGQKDRRIRQAKRQKLQREVLEGHAIPDKGIYPNLGERWNRPIEERAAITVRASSVRRLCEKVVRGITYLTDNIFIEPPYRVTFYALTDEGAAGFEEVLERFGQIFTREPGITVRRAVASEDGISSLYSIEIFGQFKMYATVAEDS